MNIGFVGAGRMAEAIMAAIIKDSVCAPSSVAASDISPERLESLAAQYGINVTSSNVEVVLSSDVVMLAVKPQDLDGVLAGIAEESRDKLVVSIAAGKTLAYFEAWLPAARIVRVMPNLACQVGEGMSAYCGGTGASAADLECVRQILDCTGKALPVAESQFDVVTALSGSGPAFFAYVLDSLVSGAVAEGMAPDVALMFGEQTMLGTAAVLQKSGDSPADFMKQVASKGGTTAAGLKMLAHSNVATDLQKTIKAAADRSREMSG